jgi:hypothetical protein
MRSGAGILSLLVLAGLGGCVRRYPQPSMEQPHADVQIRVIHHAEVTPQFDETVRIDGYEVAFSEGAPGVRTTTMRVQPQATLYEFSTEFFHTITNWVPQTYWQSQSYLCGSGRYGPQYCSRSYPVTRMVPITTRIPDGGCETSLSQTPLAGGVYLVQYEFVAPGVCQATCQRLVAGPNGSMLATECGSGEPMPADVIPPSAVIDSPLSTTPSADEFGDGDFSQTSGGESPPTTASASSSAASQLGAPR